MTDLQKIDKRTPEDELDSIVRVFFDNEGINPQEYLYKLNRELVHNTLATKEVNALARRFFVHLSGSVSSLLTLYKLKDIITAINKCLEGFGAGVKTYFLTYIRKRQGISREIPHDELLEIYLLLCLNNLWYINIKDQQQVDIWVKAQLKDLDQLNADNEEREKAVPKNAESISDKAVAFNHAVMKIQYSLNNIMTNQDLTPEEVIYLFNKIFKEIADRYGKSMLLEKIKEVFKVKSSNEIEIKRMILVYLFYLMPNYDDFSDDDRKAALDGLKLEES